jgi:hypothetical protein
VLHLDVKPSNVLIAENGRVVLADFGPAGTHAGVAALAEAGIVLGSARYVAPERLFDGFSDERSDLWSLGATLYHAVEGRSPFRRDSVDDTLRAVDEGRPDLPERAGPLTPVLLGLLRRNPAERMAAAEVRARLRRIAPASRRTTTVRAGVAMGVAAAVIAFGSVAFATQRSGADRAGPISAPAQAAASSVVPAPPSVALPAGYSWRTDHGDGFRVAVPRGWEPVGTDSGLEFVGPDGQPVLNVALWTARGDLVPALIADEKQERPPGYLRVRIVTVAQPPGAEWEYTFQDPQTGAMRALRQIVTVGGRSYRVDWRAPAADWAAALPALFSVLPTIGPAPGA